jgi:hypothetical protein
MRPPITSMKPIHLSEKLTRIGFFKVCDAIAMVNECDNVIAQYAGYDLTGTPPDLRHREMRQEAIETIEQWLKELPR